jgi:hypothetical protein
MDELADLIAALARFEERARKPKKRKKVRTTGRPAKTGPSAGCGTGSGGFKAGNNCAKEDGIPQRPLSQGGALKGANAKDDFARAKALKEKAVAKKAKKEADAKAKSIATKPQRDKARVDRKRAAEKQAKIDELRRAAAERKAQKGERDAAERKAAQEAADKKRSEMLQKIRIKKANEKLTVAGTPKSIKQEIDELKLKKASQSLKVVESPSVKNELDELKAMMTLKKQAAASPKPQKANSPQSEYRSGSSLDKKQKDMTQADNDALESDRAKVFGDHLKEAWAYGTYSSKADSIRMQQKITISMNAAKRLEAAGIKESDIDDEMLARFDGLNRYYGTSTAADRLIKDGIPAGYHRRYALSAAMVDSWAATSGDHNVNAVGIQYAIKDEFKVSRPYTKHLRLSHKTPSQATKNDWDDTIERIRKDKGVRAVIRAHYDETQARLKAQGVTHLTLVRGYGSAAKVDPINEQNVSLQPASSFSMNKSIAGIFAPSGSALKKRYLTATVEARYVLSTCGTGFGCVNEQEVVVLGGKRRGRVSKKFSDW